MYWVFSLPIGAETCLNVQLWTRWLYSALKEPSAPVMSDKGDVCTDSYSFMILIAGAHSDSIPYCYWWSQAREWEVYWTQTVDEEKRHAAGMNPNGSMGSRRSEALLSQAEPPKRRPQSQSKVWVLIREVESVLFVTLQNNAIGQSPCPVLLHCSGTKVVSHNSHPLTSTVHTETAVKNIQTEQHAAMKFMNGR